MGKLLLAMAFALALAGAMFALGRFSGLGEEAGKRVAELSLLFVLPIHKSLKDKTIKLTFSTVPRDLVEFEGFVLPWYYMVVYAASLYVVVLNALGAVATAVTVRLTMQPIDLGEVTGTELLLVIVPAYFVGGWIGKRADRLGLLAVALTAIFASLLTVVMSLVLASPAQWEAVYGAPKAVGTLLRGLPGGATLIGLFALVGYWRGRRARLSSYLAYLLTRLPADGRETVIGLAYEEAERARRARREG